MIATIDEYWKAVMTEGTPEAKQLLQMEVLFAQTEAKALMQFLGTTQHETVTLNEIHERLICLLIAHRGPCLASYLMERGRGVPLAVDGPGPVIPNS